MSEPTSGCDIETKISSLNMAGEGISKLAQCVSDIIEKSTYIQALSQLPMAVRRRLRALRKLQTETNSIEMDFHKRKFELEKEFQAKHQTIFKKRFEILTGTYEPNDDECDYPDPDILERIDENPQITSILRRKDTNKDDETGVGKNEETSTGVPHFWFHILSINPTFDYLIQKDDEPILKHLTDIRTTYQLEPHFSFTLEFEFSANPFFENSILTKEYLLKIKSDDLLSYEGPSIYKTIGCDISWKIERPKHPSVFDFFSPPNLPEDVLNPSYEEIKSVLENDFEIGDYVKDNIVPKAILYFTGELDDEVEESDEDESDFSDVEDHLEAE